MNNLREKGPLKVSGLLSTTSPNKVFLAIVLGSLAGFAYALIIPLVLKSIEQSPLAHKVEHIFDTGEHSPHYHLFGIIDISTPKLALAFLLICVFILICRATSQALLTRLATEVTVNLRKELYHRVTRLPIQDLERIGPSRLLTALNNDVTQVVGGAAVFPSLFTSLATLIGLLGFLLYLNIDVFFFIIGTIVFGAITYQIPVFYGQRFMTRARNSFDYIQECMRGLIYGAKELKSNRERRDAYLKDEVYAAEAQFLRAQKQGETLVIFGITYGDLISFLAIGLVTYAMANYYDVSRESLIGIIMVMLYITAPIVTLINAVGPIVKASVASRKLTALLNEMPLEYSSTSEAALNFHQLRLASVCFGYGDADRFTVGPVNLGFERGKVTFLVGGNGSGKTTLAKILSLHYMPGQGAVFFDNEQVTDANRDAYRQHVSSIYGDFYLFKKLFGINTEDVSPVVEEYLAELGLSEQVKIKDGVFSSTDLSSGQKKRLALLISYLENRSVYLFDEWASDQDPVFKAVFYEKILPGLKKLNKLVIVISHDDRYFHLADNVIRLDNGKVVSETKLVNDKALELVK